MLRSGCHGARRRAHRSGVRRRDDRCQRDDGHPHDRASSWPDRQDRPASDDRDVVASRAPAAGRPGHQAIAELLHLGYGTLWGAGAALSFRDRPTPAAGALFGLVTLLRPTRPPWRATPGEAVVNIAAHLAYGLTTALVVEELADQRRLGPTSDRERHAARVA